MQTVHSFHGSASAAFDTNYLLFLPEDYETRKQERWPLILFLHGSGERGKRAAHVAKHGLPKLVKQAPHFPFIVVSPQCPANQTWSNELLLAILDEVIKTQRVDARRIYLTGLSLGGYGAWALALAHPERFAAVAPICGGGSLITLLLEDRRKISALKKLPVWAFHGAKDLVVKREESERMVNAFRAIGHRKIKLTVYPEAAHDAWTETYHNPELYEWFLSHRQAKPSS